MADQLKQIAFKKFTTSEIQAGTRFDVTTNASTVYAIKSIEATQGYNDDAVSAIATAGLTTDFNSGNYVSLGTCAGKDIVGLSGTAILDSSSTLSIRPTAKSIKYTDYSLSVDNESNTADRPRKSRSVIFPEVNLVSDPSPERSTIDKTSVTFSDYSGTNFGYGGGSGTPYSYQYTVFYTNANGVALRILFKNGGSSQTGFQLHNATTGASYGYWNDDYALPFWDGGRYIFYLRRNQPHLYYFDLDESETNFQPANTLGGSVGNSYYHGYLTNGGSSWTTSFSSADNHHQAYMFHDGKRYLTWFDFNNNKHFIVQFPETIVHNTAVDQWVDIGGSSSSSGTDPFGKNANAAYNVTYIVRTKMSTNSYNSIKMSYDKSTGYFLLWFMWGGSKDTFVVPVKKDDFDGASLGSRLGNGSYGLYALAQESLGEFGFAQSLFHNSNSEGGNASISYINVRNETDVSFSQYGECFFDGKDWIISHSSGSGRTTHHVYRIPLTTDSSTGVVDLTSQAGDIEGYGSSGRFYAVRTPPSSTKIASRNYSVEPSLTIRISGVLSDQ